MKRLLAFCLAAVLLCGLCACGKDGKDDPADSTVSGGNGTVTDPTGDDPDTDESSAPAIPEDPGDLSDPDQPGAEPTQSDVTPSQGGTGDPTQSGGTTTTAGKKTTTGKVTTTTAANSSEVNMDTVFAPFLKATAQYTHVAAYDPDSDPSSAANAWSNIQAITYEGATMNGQKTKIFAYIGFPEGASASKKVPAIVLVHGGGGHAFAEWVKMWTDRGYAAIAMDNTGFFPSEKGKGIAGRESDDVNTLWHYGLYGDFAEAGYVGIPNNDEMSKSAAPIDQQWMYHALVSTIMAHKILKADSRVDGSKIGITGISWGGVITSLTIGYDTDFAFAIPVYGSAYPDESLGWVKDRFSDPNTQRMWLAQDRLKNVKIPVLWIGWSGDTPFSINSNSKSYMDTRAAGAVLNMKVNWGHSHGQGWAPADIAIFADSIVGKRPKLTAVTKEPTVTKNDDGSKTVTMTVAPASDATAVTANLAYITSPLSYTAKSSGSWATIDQTWKAIKCTVSGGTITATIAKDKKVDSFYIIVTTKTANGKYDVCSHFVEGINK